MQNKCLENLTGRSAAAGSLETRMKLDKNIERDLTAIDLMEGVRQWFRIVSSGTI
jgi:hypothetical protein